VEAADRPLGTPLRDLRAERERDPQRRCGQRVLEDGGPIKDAVAAGLSERRAGVWVRPWLRAKAVGVLSRGLRERRRQGLVSRDGSP